MVAVDFLPVIVTAPRDRLIRDGRVVATIGTPDPGAFDPAAVRLVAAEDVRAGDLVLGTCQPHYDRLLNPLDRPQWVSYFVGTPTPQAADARKLDARHCPLCAHNVADLGRTPADYVTVDGCTAYQRGTLLLVVPAELHTANAA